jgi:hypothetical protein
MQGEVVQRTVKSIFKNLVKSNRVLTQFNFQVLRNINLAREAIGLIAHNANNVLKSFVKKILRTCRGNIHDVD